MTEQPQSQWTESTVLNRFRKELSEWIRKKPTGNLRFEIDARCGGINKVLISPTICEYSCTNKN